MKSILLVGILTISAPLYAQESIPVGTVLPVQLETSLSNKSEAGQIIRARLMQDVPLGNGEKVRAGAKVAGQVLKVTPASAGTNMTISFKFDHLIISGRTVPITTDIRGLASTLEVDEAQLPDTGPDRGTPSTAYTTVQVGGDEVVYRGGGHVYNASDVLVGEPVPPDGVLARVRSNLVGACRGQLNANEPPQALWVFSSDACGVYGYANVKILDSGRNAPLGQIVLGADGGKLNIRSGSGMLLRVVASSQPGAQIPRRS